MQKLFESSYSRAISITSCKAGFLCYGSSVGVVETPGHGTAVMHCSRAGGLSIEMITELRHNHAYEACTRS
jgi:fructose-1,6-bisphosphatase